MPFEEAYKIGKSRNNIGDFVNNMRGNADVTDIVTTGKKGVKQLRNDLSSDYNSNLAPVLSNTTPIPYTPIKKAIDDALHIGAYNGVEFNPATQLARNEINKLAKKFKFTNDPTNRTIGGYDAFKKGLGLLKKRALPNTPEALVYGNVYDSVSNTINAVDPAYGEVMKNYAGGMDTIKQLEKSLSLDPKAMSDTTIRKLQSITRNNVNTNYGQRSNLVDKLPTGEKVKAQAAGQALNNWAPRGIQGPLAGAGIAFTGPTAALSIPFMSPRLMGEGALLSGKLAGSPSLKVLAEINKAVRRAAYVSPKKKEKK